MYCTNSPVLWKKNICPAQKCSLMYESSIYVIYFTPSLATSPMNPFTLSSSRNEHEPLSISIDEQNQPLNILFRLPWLVSPALWCSRWGSQCDSDVDAALTILTYMWKSCLFIHSKLFWVFFSLLMLFFFSFFQATEQITKGELWLLV